MAAEVAVSLTALEEFQELTSQRLMMSLVVSSDRCDFRRRQGSLRR